MLTINIILKSQLSSAILYLKLIALSQITFISILIGIVLLLSVIAIIVVLNPHSAKPRKRPIKSITDSSDLSTGPEYQMIIDRITQAQKKYKTILLAASGVTYLPTTIPVNTAVNIASSGKKCFLIDLDLKRDAVAMVFDIKPLSNAQSLRPSAYDTAVDGLSVWPAHNFTHSNQMNIKPLVDAAMDKFDIILINAPALEASPDRMQIASAAQCGIIFAKGTAQMQRLSDILNSADCKIIGSIQMTN